MFIPLEFYKLNLVQQYTCTRVTLYSFKRWVIYVYKATNIFIKLFFISGNFILPDASKLLSRLNDREWTVSVCPLSSLYSWPELKSHTRILLSSPYINR